MPTDQKTSNWNLPNALTVLRIVMVPFFAWALLVDGGDSVLWRTVADCLVYCTLLFGTLFVTSSVRALFKA